MSLLGKFNDAMIDTVLDLTGKVPAPKVVGLLSMAAGIVTWGASVGVADPFKSAAAIGGLMIAAGGEIIAARGFGMMERELQMQAVRRDAAPKNGL